MKRLREGLGIAGYVFARPLLWLLLHGSERVKLLITCDNRVLVVRGWLGDGKWDLPGGGIEHEETPLQAIQRELFEELSVCLPDSRLQYLRAETVKSKGISTTVHYYAAEAWPFLQVKPRPVELRDAIWLKRSDLTAANAGPALLKVL